MFTTSDIAAFAKGLRGQLLRPGDIALQSPNPRHVAREARDGSKRRVGSEYHRDASC